MTIARTTTLDRVEPSRDGTIGVRLALVLADDGEVLASTWHRTVVGADCSVADQMAAVNEHLESMKYPAVSEEDIERIEICRLPFLPVPAAE